MSSEAYVEVRRAAWEAAEERMYNADLAAKRRLVAGDDAPTRELVARIERFAADMEAFVARVQPATADPAHPEAP